MALSGDPMLRHAEGPKPGHKTSPEEVVSALARLRVKKKLQAAAEAVLPSIEQAQRAARGMPMGEPYAPLSPPTTKPKDARHYSSAMGASVRRDLRPVSVAVGKTGIERSIEHEDRDE